MYEPVVQPGVVGMIKRYLLHADPRLLGVLMRNFFWFENVLWLDEIDLDSGMAACMAGSSALSSLQRSP